MNRSANRCDEFFDLLDKLQGRLPEIEADKLALVAANLLGMYAKRTDWGTDVYPNRRKKPRYFGPGGPFWPQDTTHYAIWPSRELGWRPIALCINWWG